jgi:polyribonucleotide nucleotidyltransferase
MEDFFGDMDFKVSGTVNGITAIQVGGLHLNIFE